MSDWKYILFDLDGTLADSSEGIFRSIAYALRAAGRAVPGEPVLRRFIGPSLMDGFRDNIGMSDEEAEWARDKYRERYHVTGFLEAEIYAGMDQVLALLQKQGRQIAMATSKPEEMAVRILEHFGLISYFDEAVGATMDGTRSDKADVIREALKRLYVTEQQKDQVLMVGDRRYDIAGAKECGIASLGVYYGFAEPGELEAAGADYIVQDMEGLLQFFS